MKFSVLMSVYYKEKPEFFRVALESVANQTLKADEVVIIKDGTLTPELDKIVDEFTGKLPIKVVELEKNGGLGNALRIGVEMCSYAIIARMDSDDICRPYRFEKQIKFLNKHPEIDVVGCWISEFEGEPENIYASRQLPCENDDITVFAKKRNPFNHMTVMYRKQSVINAGNYTHHMYFEDYNLWVRMIMNGARFANIPDELVNVRAGINMVSRRSGLKYARNEYRLQKEFLDTGYIGYKEFIINILIRIPIRFMPSFVLKLIYRLLRK